MLAVTAAASESATAAPVPAPVTPGHLAYLLYTSGSSGQPKAVAVDHRSGAVQVTVFSACLGMGAGHRVLQFAAASFDASLEQLLGPLELGATVVLRGSEVPTPEAFLGWLVRRRLTHADLPPAFWQLLLATARELPEGVQGHALRCVSLGGEAVPVAMLPTWRQLFPATRLVNGYGPTEAVITATTWQLPARPARAEDIQPAPIGRPLPGQSLAVLDRQLQPVPAGVVGELYLGEGLAGPGPAGIGLAWGYHGRPALTAAAFLPDPNSPHPGARRYRSGDLARHLADGNVQFLGRRDLQLKVRGLRIEPGEIESQLEQHPGVRQAAVVLHESATGPQLVAYLQAAGPDPAPAELREFLRPRLPEFLRPAAFVTLPELPLLASGKVDRRSLSARSPEPTTLAGGSGGEQPRGPEEELIAELWRQVLQLPPERPGRHEDFFAAGGHSLLATQLLSRLRRLFAVELPLHTLFEQPTVAGQRWPWPRPGEVAARRHRHPWCRYPGTVPSPPPSPSSACGSCNASCRAAWPTTWPPSCNCAETCEWRPCIAPWREWCAATRPCAPPSPSGMTSPCRPSGRRPRA